MPSRTWATGGGETQFRGPEFVCSAELAWHSAAEEQGWRDHDLALEVQVGSQHAALLSDQRPVAPLAGLDLERRLLGHRVR